MQLTNQIDKKTHNLFTISNTGYWDHLYPINNISVIDKIIEKLDDQEIEAPSEEYMKLFRNRELYNWLNYKWQAEELTKRLILISAKKEIAFKYLNKQIQIPRTSLSKLIGLDLYSGQNIKKKCIEEKYIIAIKDYIYLNDEEFKIKKEIYTPLVDIFKIELESNESETHWNL